jgi:hypothetical protein
MRDCVAKEQNRRCAKDLPDALKNQQGFILAEGTVTMRFAHMPLEIHSASKYSNPTYEKPKRPIFVPFQTIDVRRKMRRILCNQKHMRGLACGGNAAAAI